MRKKLYCLEAVDDDVYLSNSASASQSPLRRIPPDGLGRWPETLIARRPREGQAPLHPPCESSLPPLPFQPHGNSVQSQKETEGAAKHQGTQLCQASPLSTIAAVLPQAPTQPAPALSRIAPPPEAPPQLLPTQGVLPQTPTQPAPALSRIAPPPEAPPQLLPTQGPQVSTIASPPQAPQAQTKQLEQLRQPCRQQQSVAEIKDTSKHNADLATFVVTHENLLDQLSDVRSKQLFLRQLIEASEQTKDQDMTELLEALRSLLYVLHSAKDKKDAIQQKAHEDAEKKSEDAKIKREVLDDLVPYKADKMDNLETIDQQMEAYERLHGIYRQNRFTEPNSQYDVLPEVEVKVLIKGVSSVDTAAMSFEVSCFIYLYWDDPLIFQLYTRNGRGCDLDALDWTKFFNPRICIENQKVGKVSLEAWEIPRFGNTDEHNTPHLDDKDKHGNFCIRMKKKVHLKGVLGMNTIDLSCFPFDMQILPIAIQSARIDCPNKEESKKFKLRHVTRDCLSKTAGSHESYRPVEDKYRSTHCVMQEIITGHCVMPEVEHQLIEYNFLGIRGFLGKSDGTVRRKGDQANENEDSEDESCTCFCYARCRENEDTTNQKQQHLDNAHYQIHLLVERPFLSNHCFDLVVMTVLVLMASFSFWDTAAPELSSRMGITLTITLVLAAYNGDRPPEIAKTPSATFQDRYEVCCFFLVASVSILNVVSVTRCGGENPEAPDYMMQYYQEYTADCERGWCHSRSIDCHCFLMFIFALAVVIVALFAWVRRRRRSSTSFLQWMTTSVFKDAQLEYFKNSFKQTTKELSHMTSHMSDSKEDQEHAVQKNRQRCKYVICGLLAATILSIGISLEDPLKEPTEFLRAMGFQGWLLFAACGFAACSLHFFIGYFICLIAAGYTFGIEGIIVGEIGTFFSAAVGYGASTLWPARVRKDLKYFPATIRVYLLALEVAGFRGWRGLFNVCALRNDIEITFGWVNAIVAIGDCGFWPFVIATMLSSQTQVIMWVSVGRAVRAYGEQGLQEAHSAYDSGSKVEITEAFSEASLNMIYLLIGASWMVRLGLGRISKAWRNTVVNSRKNSEAEAVDRSVEAWEGEEGLVLPSASNPDVSYHEEGCVLPSASNPDLSY